MKNNKILYLLTILIALFSFNTNVNAAKELTCVYEWDPDNNERVVVVQTANGTKFAYVTSEHVNKGNYGLDSLKYGAWEERYYKNFLPAGSWESCAGNYYQNTKEAFIPSGDGISLEASYSSALSPLTGTQMFVRKNQLESIAEKNGLDSDDYFGHIAVGYILNEDQVGYFLIGEGLNCQNSICEVEYNLQTYSENIQIDNPYAMRPQADNLSNLEKTPQGIDFRNWLYKEFCVANSDNKLCKMVFDYNYTRDDGKGTIDDNLPESCYVVHKSKDKELRFILEFWGDDAFEVHYAPPGSASAFEKNPDNIFYPYDPYTGDYTYPLNNIHFYPKNSNIQEFRIEYIKKYKDQGNCPEITFCADDASDGGYLNWYLELGSAEEIIATGKYTIGMCNNYNEVTGEIEDVKVNNGLTYNLLGGIITIEECEDLFTGDEDSKKLLENIKTLFTLSRISIPLIIIVLGSIDFVKCIFSGNEDGMKKAQNKFMKRLLIGVGIFLIPTLLKFVLEIANEIWPNISSDFCGIL